MLISASMQMENSIFCSLLIMAVTCTSWTGMFFNFFVWLGENFFRRLLPCFCYSTFSSFNAKYFLEVLQKRPKIRKNSQSQLFNAQ